MNVQLWQWILIIGSSLILFFLSPLARTANEFFKAEHRKKSPNAFMLTGTLVISAIFAKSITNAANLGLEFGIVGGIAYACYFVMFAVAGIIIYQMRTKGGFESIHHFLSSRFGRGAMVLFSVLISIRLFNDVWSNTIIIGTYFGDQGSTPYFAAIFVFTLLTLAYTLKGGLSSSIFTDVIQMGLFTVLLVIILGAIFSTGNFTASDAVTSSTWSFDMGLNLVFTALIQTFSYPFHEPVITDRAFISSPKVTLKSFLWASVISFICIVLFSLIGVYGKSLGVEGQAAVEVGKLFGVFILLVINFIMITSAASTLDSTFSSFSKLMAVDLNFGKKLSVGRLMMIILAILGTIPAFLDAEVLSATTVSGTMVIGLTPVFVFWKKPVPKISFFLSVLCGLFFGFLLVFNAFPEALIFTDGKYADLLWVNVFGILSCIILYFVPTWIKK